MPYKLRSDHPDCSGVAVVRSDTGTVVKCHPDRGKALAHLRALYANVTDAAAIPAGYVPGGPRPVVIEHHPGCPPSHPHGITDGPGGHLLACHATPEEARAITEKLDLSEPSGDGGTAAAFRPDEPRDPGTGKWAHGLIRSITATASSRRDIGRQLDRQGVPRDAPLRAVLAGNPVGNRKLIHHNTAGEIDAGIDYTYDPRLRTHTTHLTINDVRVVPQRQGIGTAMMAELARTHPDATSMKVYGAVGHARAWYEKTGARFPTPAAPGAGEWDAAALDKLRAIRAARGGFDPLKHPRIEHGHGGGEFTHAPGGGGHAGHLHDGITDPPPSAALTFNGRFTLAGAKPGDPLLAKVNAKLTRPLIGTGPNKGKVRRPAVPPYHESVARVSAAMTQLIAAQGTLEAGKKWYPDEHAMNHRRAQAYHVPIQVAIGVEAATCPRVQWLVNQRVTNELLDEAPKTGRTAEDIKKAHHFGGGVMSSFRDEGVDIILGADIDKELGGTKRRNFYNNIMWPGQTDSVTVDTWMLQSLKPLGLDDRQALALGAQAQAGLADGIGKVIVADAIRDAAARYKAQGTDITPDGVQAAAWIAIQQSLGLSDPSAHTNPRDVAYMHAAAPPGPDPDDEGTGLTDDQWDAELILQYLTWLAEKVPGGVDLGSPGSARPAGGLAADNPAAWKLALADPRFGRLGMTPAQARQAARGPATPMAAAGRAAGPFTVAENHPACPAGRPHATVHSRTGEVAGCHRTPDQAQTLALTLNFPDATPATPGAVMQVGAAGPDVAARDYVRDGRGRFAPVPGGGHRPRPRAPGQAPRQPATAPTPRRMGEGRPGPPPGAKGSPAAVAMAGSVSAADIARLIDQQVASVSDRLTQDQHRQLQQVKAELERSQAELERFHKETLTEERKAEEKGKTVRKLIHHVLALAAVAVLTFIGVKTGTVDNPMIAGLAATGPLFIQEALDAVKRV